MKKLLLPKKCWLPLALVAVLAVGCGLKIATVEFSTHEPMQETELTVKTSFVQEGDNNGQINRIPHKFRKRYFGPYILVIAEFRIFRNPYKGIHLENFPVALDGGRQHPQKGDNHYNRNQDQNHIDNHFP